MLAGVINRMGPGLLMGYFLLTTTTVSEFIAVMEKVHLPRQIIIPLSVMFRFFPTIKEESLSINNAMRMRGISFGKSKGSLLSLMEYRFVPLFISCVKIGEELSCSALTRGLGSPVKRTNICKIGFGVSDLLYGILTGITLLLIVVSKGV
jgi:energy-coupling factor transport system permease protein